MYAACAVRCTRRSFPELDSVVGPAAGDEVAIGAERDRTRAAGVAGVRSTSCGRCAKTGTH